MGLIGAGKEGVVVVVVVVLEVADHNEWVFPDEFRNLLLKNILHVNGLVSLELVSTAARSNALYVHNRNNALSYKVHWSVWE